MGFRGDLRRDFESRFLKFWTPIQELSHGAMSEVIVSFIENSSGNFQSAKGYYRDLYREQSV